MDNCPLTQRFLIKQYNSMYNYFMDDITSLQWSLKSTINKNKSFCHGLSLDDFMEPDISQIYNMNPIRHVNEYCIMLTLCKNCFIKNDRKNYSFNSSKTITLCPKCCEINKIPADKDILDISIMETIFVKENVFRILDHYIQKGLEYSKKGIPFTESIVNNIYQTYLKYNFPVSYPDHCLTCVIIDFNDSNFTDYKSIDHSLIKIKDFVPCELLIKYYFELGYNTPEINNQKIKIYSGKLSRYPISNKCLLVVRFFDNTNTFFPIIPYIEECLIMDTKQICSIIVDFLKKNRNINPDITRLWIQDNPKPVFIKNKLNMTLNLTELTIKDQFISIIADNEYCVSCHCKKNCVLRSKLKMKKLQQKYIDYIHPKKIEDHTLRHISLSNLDSLLRIHDKENSIKDKKALKNKLKRKKKKENKIKLKQEQAALVIQKSWHHYSKFIQDIISNSYQDLDTLIQKSKKDFKHYYGTSHIVFGKDVLKNEII